MSARSGRAGNLSTGSISGVMVEVSTRMFVLSSSQGYLLLVLPSLLYYSILGMCEVYWGHLYIVAGRRSLSRALSGCLEIDPSIYTKRPSPR